MAVTTGIAMAYLVNYAFKDVSGDWRWMLGVATIPGAALAIGMLTVPRTPRWLLEQGQDEAARRALDKPRAGTGSDPDEELAHLRDSSEEAGRTSTRDLFSPPVRKLMVVGLGLALFQQLVGVNTVIYYAPTILEQTGLGVGNAITQTLTVGLTNVLFTILAILLLDRVGRRPLLIAGTVTAGAALLLLAAYFAFGTLQDHAPWLAFIALLVFIAGYAIGLGPVFWLMVSEILPQRPPSSRGECPRRRANPWKTSSARWAPPHRPDDTSLAPRPGKARQPASRSAAGFIRQRDWHRPTAGGSALPAWAMLPIFAIPVLASASRSGSGPIRTAPRISSASRRASSRSSSRTVAIRFP